MDFSNLITPAVAAISGGGIVALLKHFQSRRNSFYDRLEKDNERLREREEEIEKEIDDLKAKFTLLQEKLIILEQAHHNLPIPQWIKSKEGVILSMNSHCHKIFIEPEGFSRLEAIGLTDRDIFNSDTADIIEANDNAVKEKKKSIKSVERLLIGGEWQSWAVTRYPIIQDGTLIALGGIAYESFKENN